MKAAGGGKRKGRKPTRVEPDDRPRGYEAKRMRELWRDIDDAKHKAGLGPAPSSSKPAASTWDVTALVDRAAALLGDAAAWVQAKVPVGDAAAWVKTNAPAVCAAFTSGAALLRSVPFAGRLVDLVPPAPSKEAPTERGPVTAPDHRANGVPTPRREAPDGEWLH